MMNVIEVIYEDGVLKPLATSELKDHQRYRVFIEEIQEEMEESDLEFEAELDRRTTILPDGRKVLRLGGIFSGHLDHIPVDEDPIADVLAELQRERAQHSQKDLDEYFPYPGTYAPGL